MESPNSFPWTNSQQDTVTEDTYEPHASNIMAQYSEFGDLLCLDNQPPSKKIKLEDALAGSNSDFWDFLGIDDLSAHNEDAHVDANRESPANKGEGTSSSSPIPQSSSVFQELDDLFSPCTPSENASYLETLSELEDTLNKTSPVDTDLEKKAQTPTKSEPVNTEASSPINPELVEGDVGSPTQRDLLAFALDHNGINEDQVNNIPEVMVPCTGTSIPPVSMIPVSPTITPMSAQLALHKHDRIPTIPSHQPQTRHLPPQPFMYSAPTMASMSAAQPISRKRVREHTLYYPRHPHSHNMVPVPSQPRPWLMHHPGQKQFSGIPISQLPPRPPQQPVQQRIRLYPCPMCPRGFRAPELRSAHLASGECVRVRMAVRVVSGGHGWECVVCKQQFQRRDIKEHLRAHDRGEFPGDTNNVKVIMQAIDRDGGPRKKNKHV